MLRTLTQGFLGLLLVLAGLVGGAATAHAIVKPVVADQVLNYDVNHPSDVARIATADSGEVLVVSCDTTIVGEFYPWTHIGNTTTILEFVLSKHVGVGSETPVPCRATNSQGTTNFVLTVKITGTYVMGAFHAVRPYRILDTRTWSVGEPLKPNWQADVNVFGWAGVPAAGVAAVVVNITVTQPTRAGFITAYPSLGTPPNASNVNFGPGQTVPNLAIVAVQGDGIVHFLNQSLGTAHVIVDIAGFFDGDVGDLPGTFNAKIPRRVLDTRSGIGAARGAVGPNGTVTVQLPMDGLGNPITPTMGAAALNVTVTQPTSAGFISVYPAGTAAPLSSNLNYGPRETIPNMVVVKTTPDGRVTLKNASNGSVHLVADLAGYYNGGTPTLPGTFVALPPTRVLDSRLPLGTSFSPVSAGGRVDLALAGAAGLAAGVADSVVLNVTVTQPTQAGFVSVFPKSLGLPNVSNLNYGPGQTVPNLVMVLMNEDDTVSLANRSSGTAHVVGDMFGYYRYDFAPTAYGARYAPHTTQPLDQQALPAGRIKPATESSVG